MGISVTGVEAVLQANKKMAVSDAIKIATGLKLCAEVLYRASQKLVPVETGLLKRSGRVEVTGRGFGTRANVIYDTAYAIWVHENLTKYHAPPTQARFLAAAVPKVKGTMTAILRRQLTATILKRI